MTMNNNEMSRNEIIDETKQLELVEKEEVKEIASPPIQKMRSYFKEQKANLYAIVGHPLEKSDEYVQMIYIKMLCSLIQYNNLPSEEQLLFIERLLRGIGMSEPLAEYMQKALEIDEQFAEEFVRQFKGSPLRYNFIVDALMLVTNVSHPCSEHIEFISEICEILCINQKEVTFLSQMALSILEQDSKRYMEAVEKTPSLCEAQDFACYAKNFLVGRMVDHMHTVYYYANKKTDFNKVFAHEEMARETYTFTQEQVVLENWTIDLSETSWRFVNCKEVRILNCKFIGKDKAIQFDGVNSIIIENSFFSGFSKRVMMINDCSKFEMVNTHFYDCTYIYNDSSSRVGGIYYIEDKGINLGTGDRSVKLYACVFKDCGIWNTHSDEYYYAPNNIIGYSENVKQTISYTRFYNCLAYNKGSKEISGRGGVMFNNAISNDCELTASNKIC